MWGRTFPAGHGRSTAGLTAEETSRLLGGGDDMQATTLRAIEDDQAPTLLERGVGVVDDGEPPSALLSLVRRL